MSSGGILYNTVSIRKSGWRRKIIRCLVSLLYDKEVTVNLAVVVEAMLDVAVVTKEVSMVLAMVTEVGYQSVGQVDVPKPYRT